MKRIEYWPKKNEENRKKRDVCTPQLPRFPSLKLNNQMMGPTFTRFALAMWQDPPNILLPFPFFQIRKLSSFVGCYQVTLVDPLQYIYKHFLSQVTTFVFQCLYLVFTKLFLLWKTCKPIIMIVSCIICLIFKFK